HAPSMWIRRRGQGVQVWTPAKVNLFLDVLGRRPDGYHELATLMFTVGLFDTLEFTEKPKGGVTLTCDDPTLSTGPDNLVVRAAELLRSRYAVSQGVEARLHKRIPTQAGLAGGSSDAAATLAGLSALWRLGLDARTLAALGAELGSDVSFFFHGPAAWCTGRGEIIEPLAVGRPLDLVLARPAEGLSTASVFKALSLGDPPVDGTSARDALRSGDAEALGRALFNRLEEPAERLCPAVGQVRRSLEAANPLGARMSGSGSVIFALARDGPDALRIARSVPDAREGGGTGRVCVVRSCD
ncbi:MAG: 4-(cytidine 5'-diphospho)-2-C-methyl-D-erythritol kinase, partial [Gemmataceae bacterium]